MLSKTLFLIDIEGDEFDLLDDDALKFLSKSILVIENHDFMIENKEKINSYFSNIRKHFNLEYLKYSSRNPNVVSELNNFSKTELLIFLILILLFEKSIKKPVPVGTKLSFVSCKNSFNLSLNLEL